MAGGFQGPVLIRYYINSGAGHMGPSTDCQGDEETCGGDDRADSLWASGRNGEHCNRGLPVECADYDSCACLL